MKRKVKTPEGRLRVRIVLTARVAQWSDERLYDRASAIVGRTLRPGFGLSTCSTPELIRILDDVVAATGGTPLPHRRGPRGRRQDDRMQQDRTGVVLHLATREQRDLILAQGATVFGSHEVPAFRGFLVGMTGKSDVRLLERNQAGKVIEALRAMERRGWKPRGDQALAGGGIGSSGSGTS